MSDVAAVVAELQAVADPSRLPGMARVGIRTNRAIGVSVPVLRRLARPHRRQHELALGLWRTEIHEARLLATMVADPARLTAAELETWVADVDSWDLCDHLCSNLVRHLPDAWEIAARWTTRAEGFVKRAGFALFATLAVHDHAAGDDAFRAVLPVIEREAGDERNEVRKAVNWALRQIGKRDDALRVDAIAAAERIHATGPRSARWVASDALRELRR